MKKQYLPRRNISGNTKGLLVAFGVLLLLLLVRLLMPQVFVALAEPFWKGGTNMTAGVGNVFGGFSDKAALLKENAALTQEVATLQSENAVLTTRSQDLTQLLGGQTSGSLGKGTILAGVLVRPPVSAYDTLVVGAGTADGVTVGEESFAKGGIPLGTVQSTSAHTSVIELFSSAGRTSNGWLGSTRIPVTLTGGGAGTFNATVPKGTSINSGDSVYVAGPGALPIGTVVHVDVNPSSPTMELHIQPFINLFSLTWVQISRSK